MDIETLRMRVYFLAGQLEEAKKVYGDAAGELDALKKKSTEQQTATESSVGGTVVRSGDEQPS